MTSHCYGEAMGFAGALPILPVTRSAKARAVVAARASLDQLRNRSAIGNARGVVAHGFSRKARAANHKFTLEPRLLDLIGGLPLYPTVFWLKLAIWFGRGGLDWDFAFFARMLPGLWLKRLSVLIRRSAESVPRDRSSTGRYATVPQRTAICQRQRGSKKHNAFTNHRGHFSIFNGEVISANCSYAWKRELVQSHSKSEQRKTDPAKSKN
jgi:hypothetical protein